MKIDLAEKNDMPMNIASESSGDPYYPCIYIRGKEGMEEMKMDQAVTITGRVKGIHEDRRDGKITFGIDVECMEAEFGGMSKKSEKKGKSISRLSSMADDESEIDKGITKAEEYEAEKKDE